MTKPNFQIDVSIGTVTHAFGFASQEDAQNVFKTICECHSAWQQRIHPCERFLLVHDDAGSAMLDMDIIDTPRIVDIDFVLKQQYEMSVFKKLLVEKYKSVKAANEVQS